MLPAEPVLAATFRLFLWVWHHFLLTACLGKGMVGLGFSGESVTDGSGERQLRPGAVGVQGYWAAVFGAVGSPGCREWHRGARAGLCPGRGRRQRGAGATGAVGLHEPQVQDQKAQLQEFGGRGAAGPEGKCLGAVPGCAQLRGAGLPDTGPPGRSTGFTPSWITSWAAARSISR